MYYYIGLAIYDFLSIIVFINNIGSIWLKLAVVYNSTAGLPKVTSY